MIELYLSKVTENSETEKAGNYYARVSYKQTMNVQDMAHHIDQRKTPAELYGDSVGLLFL